MGVWGLLRRSPVDDNESSASWPRRFRVVLGTTASKWPWERRQQHEAKNKQSPPGGKAVTASVEERIPHNVLWEKAAQLAHDSGRLTKKERAFLDSTSCGQQRAEGASDSPLVDAIRAANDAQKALQDDKFSLTMSDGRKVAVQERFEGLVAGFETYSGMVDAFASTSEYASLVWGVARFFFQAGSAIHTGRILWNKIEISDRLQEVLAKMVMTMAVCQVYESIYAERVQMVQQLMDKEAAQTMALRMGTALPELHAAILVFSIKARTYFQDAQKVVGAVTTALKPFHVQFKPYVDKIDEEQQAIQKLAELTDMVATRESFRRIEKMQLGMDKITDLLAPLEKKLNSIHDDVQDAKKGITALQEVHALEWLDAVDQRNTFQTHQEQRVPGTCRWILHTSEYEQWRAAAASAPSLWICGEAGSGKTILASFVAQEVAQTQDAHVLALYFGRGAGHPSSATEALSGLILQLLHLARDLDRDLNHDLEQDQDQEPVSGLLMEHLISTVQRLAWFPNRGKTIRALQNLLSEMLAIFSSRSQHHKRPGIPQGPKQVIVLLDALDACSDPAALIGSPDSPLGHSATLIITSRDTRHVADVLDGIGDSNTSNNAARTTIFRISMRSEEDISIVVDARTVNEAKLAGHREAILYIVRYTRNTLRFANLLLDDLVSQPLKAISKNLANMQLSLDASSADAAAAVSTDDVSPMLFGSPLLRTAWLGNHLSLQLLLEERPQPFSPQQVAQAVLCASQRGHARVVEMLLTYRQPGAAQTTQPVVAAAANELLAQAAQRGDDALVSRLVQQPYVDPNARNAKDQTPLTVAAKDGRASVVRALLAHPGVEVNVQEKSDDTPLIWAAYNGHAECARLLLEHPAIDPNAQNNYYDVALTYAMRYVFVDVVRLLVHHPDIDLDVASPHQKAPIHEAVMRAPRGSAATCACLQLLIDAGADVNKRRGKHNTTLALAAEAGCDDLVAILLTSPRLDRACRNENGETPLMTARRLGHDKVVTLLEK